MWAADSSWLYPLFDTSDQFHAPASEELADPGMVLVNPIVLAETLDLIRDRAGREASVRAFADLDRMAHVRIVDAPRAAAMARVMERGGVSWHDSSAICTALAEGAGLRTFDQNQRKVFTAMA